MKKLFIPVVVAACSMTLVACGKKEVPQMKTTYEVAVEEGQKHHQEFLEKLDLYEKKAKGHWINKSDDGKIIRILNVERFDTKTRTTGSFTSILAG